MKKYYIPFLILITSITSTFSQTDPCDPNGGMFGMGPMIFPMENPNGDNPAYWMFTDPYSFGVDTSGISLFEWDFGDGTTSSDNSYVAGEHEYTVGGSYNVCLHYADGLYGCDTTICVTINAVAPDCWISSVMLGGNSYIPYEGDINFDTTLIIPETYGRVFKATGNGQGDMSYDWIIDTTVYNQVGNIIAHPFPTMQQYSNMCVVMTDSAGCQSDSVCISNFEATFSDTAYSVLFYEDTLISNVDTTFLSVVIDPALDYYFDTILYNQVMSNYPYSLYDLCIPPSALDTVLDIFWVFDTTIVHQASPVYTYNQIGMHSICLYMEFVKNNTPYYSSLCYDFEITLKSSALTFVVDGADLISLDLPEIEVLENVFAYPNPSKGEITISGLENEHPAFVKIISSTGQLVKEITISNNEEINIEELENGFYFLVVQQEGKKTVLKVVKE